MKKVQVQKVKGGHSYIMSQLTGKTGLLQNDGNVTWEWEKMSLRFL